MSTNVICAPITSSAYELNYDKHPPYLSPAHRRGNLHQGLVYKIGMKWRHPSAAGAPPPGPSLPRTYTTTQPFCVVGTWPRSDCSCRQRQEPPGSIGVCHSSCLTCPERRESQRSGKVKITFLLLSVLNTKINIQTCRSLETLRQCYSTCTMQVMFPPSSSV